MITGVPPDPALDAADFAYLTTTGRVTGLPRTIEIWFALAGETVYFLSGGRDRSDWVKNARRRAEITVSIADREFAGRARILSAGDTEDGLARRLLLEKYGPRYAGDLTSWGRTSLPVAVDLLPGNTS